MRHEIGFRGLRLTRASEDDGRTVEGIAVPFGDVIDVWGQRETFDPDTVFDGLDTAKLYYQHNQLIGSITHGENQPGRPAHHRPNRRHAAWTRRRGPA